MRRHGVKPAAARTALVDNHRVHQFELECVPVTDVDVTQPFDCGVPTLNEFFTKRALSNSRRKFGSTFVLRRAERDPEGWPEVLGFYTLSAHAVELSKKLSRLLGHGAPRALPVVLIGRLARDRRAKGGGVGERLLVDALGRALNSQLDVAWCGVVVDAKDEAAIAFYEKYDFAPLSDEGLPRRMFLSLDTARTALGLTATSGGPSRD